MLCWQQFSTNLPSPHSSRCRITHSLPWGAQSHPPTPSPSSPSAHCKGALRRNPWWPSVAPRAVPFSQHGHRHSPCEPAPNCAALPPIARTALQNFTRGKSSTGTSKLWRKLQLKVVARAPQPPIARAALQNFATGKSSTGTSKL
jgi:hypothetical protein